MSRNRWFSLCVVLLCAFAVAVFSCLPAWGQTTATGTITGLVTDNTNAVVVGATVTLVDRATTDTRTTTTNGDGRYVFVNVDPGSYDIKFTKAGFSETVVPKVTVQVATQLTENAQLKLGAVSTTVTVTESAGAELQTMNSTVGTTIEHQELLQLPNPSRDATGFATLQPGTNITGNTIGAVQDQNTFQLDGGNVTDDMSGDSDVYVISFSGDVSGVGTMHSGENAAAPSGVIPAPVESVEEFKVGVANQTADFNGGAGGQVQMVTKKGTNSFHGAAYEYYLDNNFAGANTWDDNNVGVRQPTAKYDRFGVNAGGPMLPKMFGGRTYIFGDYEGYRNPSAVSFERSYPSPLLRSGMIGINNLVVNLNPGPTAVPSGMPASFYAKYGVTAGQMIPTTMCPGGPCDPRGLGINPVISSLWSTYLPLPNDYTHGDGVNYAGYKANLAEPDTSNFGVARIDHDFSSKWHFNGTYHYFRRVRTTANQVDVGGFFPGDKLGDYKALSTRPQNPWFYTAGMTTNISSTLTNDFHYSGTRNWWAYQSQGGVPNVAGYTAALEIGGETSGSFQPYNTDNQNTRWRYWNGHDNMFRDDLTKIWGKHLFTFGGIYQRNYDAHERIDNGGAINIYTQYLIGQGTGVSLPNIDMTPYIPAGVTTTKKYGDLYANILGMVTSTQALFTRSNGTTLALLPQNSCAVSGVAATAACMASPPAINKSIIPFYNAYFNDAWQMKPSFTLSYGLGYTVEMPPYSPNAAQDIAVDQNGNILNTANYLAAREGAALQGLPYDPQIGFATITNVTGHPKYPYNPFYAGLSPRLSAAWNPHFDSDSIMGHIFGSGNTVLRGGWARIYGRLNGVDQVLVPILAPGLMQTVQCYGPNRITGGCGAAGGGSADVSDVFRVGVDGTSAPITAVSANLPQPWYPGINDVATGSGEGLDPNFRPNRSDEFNFSIQRQLNPKVILEVGYIGRIIRNEFIAYDLNNVPYMMSMGGQTFAQAWAALAKQTNLGANPSAATPQPFFEAALQPSFCTGFSSCTQAFLTNNYANIGTNGASALSYSGVWDAWTSLSNAGAFNFGRTMLNDPIAGSPFGANGQATDVFENQSNGYGNYNGGYFSLAFNNWHGLTMKTNLTFSKSLGTQAVVQASSEITTLDPYNLHNSYGVQPFDETWAYNLYLTYELPFYRDQHGLAGRLLGGWSFSPLFVAGSGFPVQVQTANGNGESYGEGDANNESGLVENGILIGNLDYTNTRKEGIPGSGGVGTAGAGQNVFTDPAAAWNAFRNPILGIDGQDGGAGPLRGLPFWNLSMSINKNVKFTERLNASFYAAFTNILNHMQPADPTFALYDPTTFGVLGGGGNVQGNTPRQMEIGLRIGW
jgi:hypothetical protein